MKKTIKEQLRGLSESDETSEFEPLPFDRPDTEVKDVELYNASYDNVVIALKNELINHSAVIRGLWGTSDDTQRSLFKKKLDRSKSDSGSGYRFNEEEIGRIVTILTTFKDKLGGQILTKKKKD